MCLVVRNQITSPRILQSDIDEVSKLVVDETGLVNLNTVVLDFQCHNHIDQM